MLESIATKFKSFISNFSNKNLSLKNKILTIGKDKVKLSEKELKPLIEEFELSLLEADVSLNTAEIIKERFLEEILDKEIPKDKIEESVKEVFKEILEEILIDNEFNLEELIENKPFKILFVGPNGAGKTTTIAKFANMLKNKGFSVVLAASDTFRAAAIEQLEEHAKRLKIPIIKGKYGSDPTAVAFDAVNYAKAHNIDVVLIDTAGRQNTNISLIKEMEKMIRVIKPDLKIYIGESIAGHALIEQIKDFDNSLKLDGVILTKLDCDAKGGIALSIFEETKVPILYITTGQGYNAIEPFRKELIISKVI